jgi:hypothetical protein
MTVVPSHFSAAPAQPVGEIRINRRRRGGVRAYVVALAAPAAKMGEQLPEAGMPLSFRVMLLAAILPLAAGCASRNVPEVVEIPPLAAPEPEPAAAPAPVFPVARLDLAQAEVLLAGDPMAQRFLALKGLLERGQIVPDEAQMRRSSNLGALLPLSAPRPPAAGLERPIPPVSEFIDRFTELGTGKPRGTDASREAERAFLLDSLLPKAPASRQQYAPHDRNAVRALKERLGRLEDCGLVSTDERAAELEALDKLVATAALPETLVVAAAPEKPKAKKKVVGSGGRGSRMPGGVSGKLEVIPSPAGAMPPPLGSGATGPAGIHLLSMGTATHGEKAWDALKKEHAELAELGYKVSRADLGDLGVTYRLIAGPVEPAQAEKLCAALKPRGQTCTPTPFPAQ